MMSINLIKKGITLVIGALLIVFTFWSCEDFQSEDFYISDLDNTACKLLNPDSIIVEINYTIVNSDTVDVDTVKALDTTKVTVINVPQVTKFNKDWKDSVFFENISEIMDTLEANNILVTDNDFVCFQIQTPLAVDTNYVLLTTDLSEVVCFLDTFIVNINLINSNGSFLTPEDRSITPETVYHCPEIQLRNMYRLTENRYLMQIVEIDKQEVLPFRLAILRNR